MKNLKSTQKELFNKICGFFYSDIDKVKIYVPVDFGRTVVIASAIQQIMKISNNNTLIAVLSNTRMNCERIKFVLLEEDYKFEVALHIRDLSEQKILVTTYQDIIKNPLELAKFDLIICDEAQSVKGRQYFDLLIENHTKFLGIFNNAESSKSWFYDAICLYNYMLENVTRGRHDVHSKHQLQDFLVCLLQLQKYDSILEEVEIPNKLNRNMRADIIAQKGNKKTVIEVKSYRSLHNSKTILSNALRQILDYKQILVQNNENQEFIFIVVLPCEIEEELQSEIYNQYNIVVWDINNLIYLCQEKKELINLLMSCMPYPLLGLNARKPLGIDLVERESIIKEEVYDSLTDKYAKQLENCISGQKDGQDRQYEIICTEIIKCLFETEFFIISEQHRTDDNMFRMDLLCSLKGTTEFWKFLISFYHTKFVVFEYKNYSDFISQNYIYITEKYLFPVALRNVAFIVSRKGFDKNASKAALGCLRENGKLIISLSDEDLIKMIWMKENGEEPSDYLLEKVEYMLMAVSK